MSDLRTALPLQPSSDSAYRSQRALLGAGGRSAWRVACAPAGSSSPTQFFHSYLVAYLFWAGIALGCLAWSCLTTSPAAPGASSIRRPLESATRTLAAAGGPASCPSLLGLAHLYLWAVRRWSAHDAPLQHKARLSQRAVLPRRAR